MSEIELTYFPIHGFRGLLARMVLDLSDLKYTENTIQFKDWGAQKPSKTRDSTVLDLWIWSKNVIFRKFNGIPAGNKSGWSQNGTAYANAGLPLKGLDFSKGLLGAT